MRRAAKVDLSQSAIVSALRAAGCSVTFIGKPLDLLAGRAGKTFILECKSGDKKRGDLTPAQVEFFRDWRGHAAVVCNPEEALRAVGL